MPARGIGRTAPLWKRSVALFVDTALVLLALVEVEPYVSDDFLATWVAPIAPRAIDPSLLVLVGIPIAYFTVTEWLFGYSFGKVILGLGVREDDGSPLGLARSFVRNVLLIVDVVVGVLFVLATADRQRLGDLVAKTVVVELP